MTKLNGYNDKLFAIEQELPDLFDESQLEIDYELDSVDNGPHLDCPWDSDDDFSYN